MADEWWKQYFPLAAIEQIESADSKNNVSEADWIVECLAVKPPAAILDVPCGEGRLSREMAARGYRVTGVDITESLLEQAQKRSAQAGLPVEFKHGDMRNLPWTNTFDGAFCYFGSFGYFDDEGNRTFVKAVAAALKPGAWFFVETHIMETLLPVYTPRGWHRAGDITVLQDRSIDLRTGRVNAEWTYITAGKEAKATTSIRLYTFREMVTLFEEAGFTDCEGFDTTSRKSFAIGARRLTFVARRSDDTH